MAINSEYLTEILLALLIFTALNFFIFRIKFSQKTYDPDNFTPSAKQSRFSMNVLNVFTSATCISIWLHHDSETWHKLAAFPYFAIAAYFIHIHHQLSKKIISKADQILSLGFSVTVFLATLYIMFTN